MARRASSRNVRLLTVVMSRPFPGLSAAQPAINSSRERPRSCSRSSGGAVQTRLCSWLMAWVRALFALMRATRKTLMDSTFPSRVLAAPLAVPACTARAAATASNVSDFCGLAAFLPVGPVDFQHLDSGGQQVAGQPCAVAAGAFHPNQLQLPEAAQPGQQLAIAGRCCRKRLGAQKAAAFVQGCGDMHVEVGVDTADHSCHCVHANPFRSGVWHRADRDGGQDSNGPVRQAPSRSLRPTGRCRDSDLSRADGSYIKTTRRRQPESFESDPARTLTRTLPSADCSRRKNHPHPCCRISIGRTQSAGGTSGAKAFGAPTHSEMV